MANFLNSQFSVNFVRCSPPENLKLLNLLKKQESNSYESGERILQAGDSDISLVDISTNVYIVAEKYINITLSTGETLKNVEMFCYSGKTPIGVSVSNASSTVNHVAYAAGTVVPLSD